MILPEVIRCQHPGIIGLSGVGKSHFVERLIRQDVAHGTGFVLFDVHGDLAERVIRYPADRSSADPEIHRRTVIIEPFDSARVFGFNPLLYRAVV